MGMGTYLYTTFITKMKNKLSLHKLCKVSIIIESKFQLETPFIYMKNLFIIDLWFH